MVNIKTEKIILNTLLKIIINSFYYFNYYNIKVIKNFISIDLYN